MVATQHDSPMDKLALTVDLKHITVDVSTQTEDILSDHDSPNTPARDILAQKEGCVDEDSCPSDSLAPTAKLSKIHQLDLATRTPEHDLACTSRSGSLSSGPTLVNTPTE